jgi:hypothetical protein
MEQAWIFEDIAGIEEEQKQRQTEQEFSDRGFIQEQTKRSPGTASHLIPSTECLSQSLEANTETNT